MTDVTLETNRGHAQSESTRLSPQETGPGRVPSEIDARLNALEASGLIRQAQALPDLQYLFRHALLQDAAYRSLVRDDRRAQHSLVGQVLERLYPERLEEFAAMLALHFDEAGEEERALKYYTQAGDFALRRYANAEAISHYTCALDILRRSPGLRAAPVSQLYTRRGRAFELSGQFEQALANYTAMEAYALDRDDRVLMLAALTARATIHSTPSAVHNPALARTLSGQALDLARELGDRQAQARNLWNLMILAQFSGHMRDAVTFGEESLSIARELDLPEQLAYTLNDIVRAYLGVGRFARAWEALDEARPIWRALGNQPMLTDNLGRSARIYCAVGEYERAIAAADEARRLSESIGNLWGQAFCRMFVGMVHSERGDMTTAIETMTECIRIAGQAGLVMALVGTRADLAWLYGTLGAQETGMAMARAALTTAEQRLPVFRPWAVASLARLQVMRGDLEAARASVLDAYSGLELEDFSTPGAALAPLSDAELAIASHDYARAASLMGDLSARLRKIGMRSYLSDAEYLKGRALWLLGQADDATRALREARAEAESVGSRRMLWQILAALSEIEEAQGRHLEAMQLRAQARGVLSYIAAHIPTPEQRDSFVRQPAVRASLDAP